MTAGILPSARRRRAKPLPKLVRRSARTLLSLAMMFSFRRAATDRAVVDGCRHLGSETRTRDHDAHLTMGLHITASITDAGAHATHPSPRNSFMLPESPVG